MKNNAGAAESNDKQLLMSSGADVYVTVDLMKITRHKGARLSLVMQAYETASGTIWASEDAGPIVSDNTNRGVMFLRRER